MSSQPAVQAPSGGLPWHRRRWLPVVALVAVAGPALLLRGRALHVLMALTGAAVLGVAVSLWQRQGESLRREQDLLRRLRAVGSDLGRTPPAGRRRGEPTSVRAHLLGLSAVTREVHDQLAAAAEELDRVRDLVDRADRRRSVEGAAGYRQVEAALNLFTQLPVTTRMPGMRGWAVSPDLMSVLIELLRQRRPGLVVEIGGGSSTVWLALAVRTFGLDTRIVTLEHDQAWVGTVRRRLAAQGLQDVAEVRHAPLVQHELDDGARPWYDRSGWDDLAGIDLLMVDGPPATTGPLVRYPAVPLLLDRLGPQAVVVVDDAVRKDEQEMARRWTPLLTDFTRLDLPVEKKAILFVRGDLPAL